jgi:hypothetical protein
MPPKKASVTGAVALQPLDPNQETLSLREARSQKRKVTSSTLQEEELDQEIRNMEMLHQQVQRKKEKMARLADDDFNHDSFTFDDASPLAVEL